MNYSDDNRGVIQNRARRKQIIDFSKLRYGNITPTDIDGFIEYKDKIRILIEIKYRGTPEVAGQNLAFTRLCVDEEKLGKPTIYIIAEHSVDNPDEDIDAAECIVRKWFFKGRWQESPQKFTLQKVIQEFIKQFY